MDIQNKTCLISGGASGLGLATAKLLVEHGGKVILADINEEAGAVAKRELGEQALFIPTDISDEDQVRTAVERGSNHFKGIQVLVNCAGIGPAERILGRKGMHRLSSFAKTLEVNLTGSFNMIRFAAEAMEKNEPGVGGERGVIINTASIAAFDGQIGQAAYAASKGGIVAMTLPIAREFARMGVRVLCIAPGIFETPMLQNLPEEIKDSLGKQIPFPSRLGQPAEFASLVKQIIENQMLNGEVIRLDGAIRMAAR